jgi:hypothetical protein
MTTLRGGVKKGHDGAPLFTMGFDGSTMHDTGDQMGGFVGNGLFDKPLTIAL